MFTKQIQTSILTIFVFSFLTFLTSQGVTAEPFMDGFPDWAQDAMGGSD